MKLTVQTRLLTLMLASSLAFCLSAGAQQTAPPDALRLQSYELGREVSLVGTVVKYETASSALPMGAHLLLQTSSGQVDVHVGDARVLKASKLELNAGDSVRIVGETLVSDSSTFFAARIVQKGSQGVAVRTTKGFLTRPGAGISPSQTEALRGVR
jgi:hypothetical protein